MNTKSNGVEFTQMTDPENKTRLSQHLTAKSLGLKSEKTIAESAAHVKKQIVFN